MYLLFERKIQVLVMFKTQIILHNRIKLYILFFVKKVVYLIKFFYSKNGIVCLIYTQVRSQKQENMKVYHSSL